MKTQKCLKCPKRYKILSIDKGKEGYCASCFKKEFGEWSSTWRGEVKKEKKK